jgi:glucose/mannose-6-phosphate isomerase
MIEKDIREYAQQFSYEPEVKSADKVGDFEAVVIGGMGGSGLVAGILRTIKPELDVVAHHEYGLPQFVDRDTEKRLFIAISHSGETEEVIDFCQTAIKRGFQTAVISAKGKLLELAEKNNLPHINLPGDDIQPRMALGYMLRAILKLIGEDGLLADTGKLSNSLKPAEYERQGRELSETLFNKVPVIYASRSNQTLAYNWKIKLNETGKIPAFYNVFPELNHNEMQGFDIRLNNRTLSSGTHFIFLEDDEDHPRIRERMKITSDIYKNLGLPIEHIKIKGKTKLEKIFNTLMLGDWTAYYTALKYGGEPESVSLIEKFKETLGA